MRFQGTLREKAKGIGVELSEEVLQQAETYYRLLSQWNRKINLTALRKLEEVIIYHFVESFFASLHMTDSPSLWADVGSGAGFPALPIKMLRRRLKLYLIEPHQKKAHFLKEVVRRLGLPEVWPMAMTLQEFQRCLPYPERFRYITSRAWGALPQLIGFCRQSLEPEGRMLLFVGEKGCHELTRLEMEGLMVERRTSLPTREMGFLVEIRRA
ncbi:16S rRNA (guanine(527)-N(7))-methyltransferase RsmG [bacterium (candidate division B38) B3_B38]|nr:MAG: 16S rRNA (guanine(527)-N(7))-methyltransferase RsmG [bacterium (candidate division B38) B3_B38]